MNRNRTQAQSKWLPRPAIQKTADFSPARRRESLYVFIIFLIFNLAAVLLFNLIWVIGNSDSLSRTANAYYVLFSREPHLAAIGFVWPPLPSLLQLLTAPIFKVFNAGELSGPFVTAFFSAGCIVFINLILALFKVPEKIRWLLLLLVAIQPNYFYLSASGMAEPMLLFFLLVVIWGFLQIPDKTRSWVACGFGLALGFYVRYESLAAMVSVAVAIIIYQWSEKPDWAVEMEGWLLSVLTPPVYALGMWLFLNWILMGTPFYFQQSIYSLSSAPDVAQNLGVTHPLFLAWGDVFYTIQYAVARCFQQNMAFIVGGVLAAFMAIIRKDRAIIGVMLILISIPAFTAAQVFMGTLAFWTRYWFYAVPFGAIIIGALYRMMRGVSRKVVMVISLILFAASAPLCLNAMRNPNVGKDEQRLSALILAPDEEPALRKTDQYWIDRRDGKLLAEVTDRYSENGLILVDASKAYALIMQSKHPERLMIASDSDFNATLASPFGRVKYILISRPVTKGVNIIEFQFPGLYERGKSWAKLVWESKEPMESWRLYEVNVK